MPAVAPSSRIRYRAPRDEIGNIALLFEKYGIEARVADLVYTDRLSGVHANFLRPSLERHGIDVATLPPKQPFMGGMNDPGVKLWKDLWSAGHGVATITDVPPVAELVDRLVAEYAAACVVPPSPALAAR